MIIFYQIKAILIGGFSLLFVLFPGVFITFPFNLRQRLKVICPAWSIFGRLVIKHACHAKIMVSQDQRSSDFKVTPAHGLYISNHQSFIDIPLISTIYQIPPIMKKEVLYIPFFGWIAWLSGALPVSRTDLSSRKKVFTLAKRRILDENLAVQVYPEGTRSLDAIPKDYSEIKKALLVFAYKEKIPVIPTSVYGTRGVLSKRGIIRPNKKLGIIVHQEIYPEHFESAEEFAKTCWDKVRAGHDEIEKTIKQETES
jgi:1-acyl-sn-glycerol-3-phosphate acyltransferase